MRKDDRIKKEGWLYVRCISFEKMLFGHVGGSKRESRDEPV